MEEKHKEVFQLARQLYLILPWWKRWQFRKWIESNNWDVKDIYTSCLREAKSLIREEERFN